MCSLCLTLHGNERQLIVIAPPMAQRNGTETVFPMFVRPHRHIVFLSTIKGLMHRAVKMSELCARRTLEV